MTLTVDLYPIASDTAAQSAITLTEATNRKTVYTGTVTAAAVGRYIALVKSGSDFLGNFIFNLKDDTETYFAEDPGAELRVRTPAAELSAVPAATPSMEEMIQFIYMALRNQKTATSSAITISNGAGTPIATRTVSTDGTTLTTGEYT